MLGFLLLVAVYAVGVRGDSEGMSIACDFALQAVCADFASSPLCASDDKTYQNDCFFAQTHCLYPSLHKEHDGACGNPLTGTAASGQSVTFDLFCNHLQHLPCGDDHIQLCGSNGQTYANLCVFEKAKCANYGLDIEHTGPCSA